MLELPKGSSSGIVGGTITKAKPLKPSRSPPCVSRGIRGVFIKLVVREAAEQVGEFAPERAGPFGTPTPTQQHTRTNDSSLLRHFHRS
jgi:tRNA(Ile2) C34 agmatinyltransferase TiaS